MLELILPTGVESEEYFGVPPGGPLFPAEQRVIAHAVDSRRREYAVVRSCARVSLARLGLPPAPILPGIGGAPVWPDAVQGSMTHCAGYAAAAVGLARRVYAIGIDAEPDAPLPEGVLEMIATPAERARLPKAQAASGDPHWDRLLFSAKEALYKAWFPLVREWLDAQEAEIHFDPRNGTFQAVLLRAGLVIDDLPVTRVGGCWTRDQGILVTSVVLSRRCPGVGGVGG